MEQILQSFSKGDERAFKDLFNHFFKPACGFVSRFVAPEDVEDVVQDTFINIWKKRELFSDIIYFKAYLYKSLYNNSLFLLRQRKPEEGIDPKLVDYSDNVFKTIITEEVHAEIIRAIEKLPAERKKIIKLSMDDLSPEEVAKLLSISVNTVKTQKRKAYAFLREELKGLFSVFLFLINSNYF